MVIRCSIVFVASLAASIPAFAHPGAGVRAIALSGLSASVSGGAVAAMPATGAFNDRDQEQQDRERERQDRDRERQQRARERELETYDQGTEALDQQRWDRAIAHFTRVAELNGARADGALYWKAYALNRQGQRAEALTTLAELTRAHPNSRYLQQAKALELDIRGAAGQAISPDAHADEELKLLAIQSMQHTDPERAVPLLEKVIAGTGTPRVKAQALFVLAQSNSPRAHEVLKNLARGSSTPELQSRAIQYLGVHGSRESREALAEVYTATDEVDVKKRILRAFMVSGERDRLFAAARTESNPELRDEAVRQLGVMGAHDQLWQLYQKEASADVKKRILTAMFTGGNTTRMIELARTEKDPELRRTAVRNLGLMSTASTGPALVEIYASDPDAATRRAVVNALFIQANATALVALARKEQDAGLKKAIVQKLALMQDKVATDYMLELLNR